MTPEELVLDFGLNTAMAPMRERGIGLVSVLLVQVPIALAFRVSGLTRLDLGAVMTGELERRRMQLEPSSLRLTERTHPVRSTQLRTPPAASKKRTIPSKVCSRSMLVVNLEQRPS